MIRGWNSLKVGILWIYENKKYALDYTQNKNKFDNSWYNRIFDEKLEKLRLLMIIETVVKKANKALHLRVIFIDYNYIGSNKGSFTV